MLKTSGAHAVIQSEFETSIEFTKQALIGLDMNRAEISEVLSSLEERRYSVLSMEDGGMNARSLMPFPKDDNLTVWFKLYDENIVGKSIAQANFRNLTGCTIVALRRLDKTNTYPNPDFVFENGDELCIVGDTTQVEKLEQNFQVSRFTQVFTAG